MNGNLPGQQAPQEEALERLAEATPLYMAPRLVAVEDYRMQQADYRNRISDAHRIGLMKLGVPPDLLSHPVKASDMGDLSIAGDTYQYFPQAAAAAIAAPPATPPPEPTATTKSGKRVTIDDVVNRVVAKLQPTQAPQSPVTQQPTVIATPLAVTQPTVEKHWSQYLWPALAVLGLGTAGGMAVYNYASSDTPAAVDTDTDTNTQYQFEISSEKGTGLSTD